MKKIALIIALGAFTVAGVQASGNVDTPFAVYQEVAQDKSEINPEDLPQAVKGTIQDGEDTKDLTISKAYQVTDEQGNVYYKVVFGEDDDAVTKKYDAEGNEVKKDKKKADKEKEEWGNPDDPM